MHNLIFFCKTYSGDFKKIGRLISTYRKYNKDNIPLVISCPSNDIKIFKDFNNTPLITIITDESYAQNYMSSEPILGFTPGYINQEICKLAFWETNITNNYLCIDSDTYFIRNFYLIDFMHDLETPYSVLVMDKDLATQDFDQVYWDRRQTHIKKIFDIIELKDPRFLTCHGMTVFSRKVLESFQRNFLAPQKWSYLDIIKISPFEFTWYNAWLQKSNAINVYAVEPFFKVFHYRREYIFSILKGLREKDLARSYLGIVMQSNWHCGLNYQNKNPVYSLLKLLIKII